MYQVKVFPAHVQMPQLYCDLFFTSLEEAQQFFEKLKHSNYKMPSGQFFNITATEPKECVSETYESAVEKCKELRINIPD